jgi:hypothetical protein
MDYASILRVLVQVDGLTKATAGLATLDAAQKGVAGSATSMGRDVDTAASKTRALQDDVAKATTVTRGLGDEVAKTGQRAVTASSGFSEASLSVQKARAEMDRAGSVSRSTMGDLVNLGSRGVGGLDRDLTRTNNTIRKAQDELERTGGISRRTARDLATLGSAGGGAGGGIGAMLGALSAGGGGISAFGLTALVAIPVVVALVGVVVALAAALGPLAGLGAAAAVGLSAAAQGFGVFKLATMGIGDALKEQTSQHAATGAAAGQSAQQQRSAARAIQSAMDGVRTAHDQVRTATQALTAAEEQSKAAQVGLTQARTDAARGLVDMASGLEAARIAEADATLALGDAKKALADLIDGADSGKVAAAANAVTAALHSQQGAVLALGDAQRTYDDLIAGPGAQKLLETTQSVTEALHGQQAAQLALTDAKKAYDLLIAGPTAEDAGKAQLSLSQAQHAQQQAVMDLADAQKNANDILNASSATDAQKAKAALALANAQDQVAAANFRVGDAQGALDKLQAGPGDSEKAKALLAVEQAQDRVASATNGVATTQQALDKLNAGPTDTDKAKALLAVQQAQDQVTGATAGQAEAQAALDKLNAPASAEELSKALLAVQGAQNGLATSTRDRVRLEKDFAKAQLAGVDGAEQVVAASKAVKTAIEQEANARIQLRNAIIAVDRAEQAVGDAQANAAESAVKAAAGAGKLNEAMNKLPAPAQAFVRQLISLKPKLDELRTTAAEGFFPGAGEGLTAAVKNFEPVKKVVSLTSTALGDLARKAGELVGSAAFGKDIETVGGRNAKIIGTLGDAALHVVSAVRHLIVEAGPLTSWLAGTADGWAKNADESAKAGRESGKLADFFERTRDVLERIGSITGHVAHGLFGVGKASKDSGDDMLVSIDKAAGRFDEWANSTRGQSSLTEFFERSKELIANLVPVLEGVGKATATIGFGPMSTALKLAGPHAEALTYAFVGYKVAATAVEVALKAYTAAQWLANAAMSANPIVLIVAGLVLLAAGFVLAYEKVDWFHKGVDDTFSWIKDHWPLLLAILTGPIGLAVYAIVKYGDEIVGFFKALPGRIVDALKAAPEALKGAGSWTVDQIIAGFKTVTSLLGTAGGWLKNRIVELVHATAEDLTGLGGWALAKVVGGIKTASDALGAVGSWLLGQVKGSIDSVAGNFVNRGKDVIGWVIDGVTFVSDKGLSAVSGIGSWLLGQLKTVLEAVKGDETHGFVGLGKTVVGWVISGLKAGLKSIGNFAKDILNIVGKIPGVGDIADKGKDAIDKVIGKLAQGGQFGGAGKGTEAFARGGITSGGYVNKPIVLMGEEAPAHPEWVIPTNPAYRSRALALHQAAGKAIGLAKGGTYAASYFGGHDDPSAFGHKTASGAIANDSLWGFAELSNPPDSLNFSALGGLPMGTKVSITYGDRTAKDVPKVDVGAGGPGIGSHIRAVDMTYAVAKALGFGGGGLVDVGFGGKRGGGVLDAVGGALSGAAGAVSGAVSGAAGLIAKGPGAIIDMLPGVGDLPDWLKGTGRYVLDHVGDWIKDKVAGLIPGLGGGGGGAVPMSNGRLQLPATFTRTHDTAGLAGYPAIDVFASPGTGVLSPVDGVVSRFSGHSPSEGAYAGAGGPFGWSMYLDGAKASYFLTHFGSRSVHPGQHVRHGDLLGTVGDYPGGVPDHIHEGVRALAKGGVFGGLPFGGSFAQGGIVPGPLGAPTAIIAHGGEEVVSTNGRGRSDAAPQVNFYGPVSMRDERDAVVLARAVGWEIAR